MAGQRC